MGNAYNRTFLCNSNQCRFAGRASDDCGEDAVVQESTEGTLHSTFQDISFGKSGAITKQILQRAQGGEIPSEAAIVHLQVDSVRIQKSDQARSFSGPCILQFVVGNGDLCDALECAAATMSKSEKAVVVSKYADCCNEAQLGLDQLSAEVDGPIEFVVHLLDINNVADPASLPEQELLEFVNQRFKVASALQTKHKRFGLAAQRYQFILSLLSTRRQTLELKSSRDDAARLMHACTINLQASLAYATREEEVRSANLDQAVGTARFRICHDNACRQAGSEALQEEIEELFRLTGRSCKIESASCFGRCTVAPCARGILKEQQEQRHIQIEIAYEKMDSVEKSEEAVTRLSGVEISVNQVDPSLVRRLSANRKICLAEAAQSCLRWNRSLGYLSKAEEVAMPDDEERLIHIAFLQAESFQSVGLLKFALDKIDWLLANLQAEQAVAMIEELQLRRMMLLVECGGKTQVDRLAEDPIKNEALRDQSIVTGRQAIEGYAMWRLQAKRHCSEQTSIFSFECCDGPTRRGEAHGLWQLWHLTALAHVGTNVEGPLLFVEREYTPISTAQAWKEGLCELLIKKYEHGVASTWFHDLQEGAEVHLSEPQATLMLPSLVTLDAIHTAFPPNCVLYIAGGTGIAPFIGILEHFKSTDVAVELLYGCRIDDVLLLDELQKSSSSRFHITVALTPEAPGSDPLSVPCKGRLDAFDAQWLEVSKGRIDGQLIQRVIRSLTKDKLRVVICGPQAMNDSVFEALQEGGVPANQITVLKA